MPFKSKAQQAFMYAVHPGIAARWQKETKDAKDLPAKKSPWLDMKKKGSK